MQQLARVLKLALVLSLLICPLAWAQVPLHPPGSVCFTPQFWCWAPYAGPVGAVCSCPTPSGWVSGRLG